MDGIKQILKIIKTLCYTSLRSVFWATTIVTLNQKEKEYNQFLS